MQALDHRRIPKNKVTGSRNGEDWNRARQNGGAVDFRRLTDEQNKAKHSRW